MLAFLFVWQILFAGPLEIASGNIGLVQYLRVFLPNLSELDGKLLAAGICALLVFALYRRIDDIAKLMFGLWSVMLLTTGWVIVTGILHFDPALAFDLPENAFRFDLGFLASLGEGSAEVLYLFLGYYQVCYLWGSQQLPLFPDAAKDGVFFRQLAELHPTKEFPHRSLLLVGAGAICASFFSLDHVIKALMAARILIQFLGHTFALFLIRSRRPDIARPFSMWGYPLPAILSIVGYIYVFLSLGATFILFGIGTLLLGVVVYLAMARRQREWPFTSRSAQH